MGDLGIETTFVENNDLDAFTAATRENTKLWFVETIGRNLEKNILKTLERTLKNEREKYEKFWAEFGKSL